MLATDAVERLEGLSTASVEGHIWGASGPVKHFLQFYFTPPLKAAEIRDF
jgi:hypothetical protein